MKLDNQHNGEEIDLFEIYSQYIKPYTRLYIKAAFIFGFIFAVFSFFVTPTYKATVLLQVNTNGNSSLKLGGLASLAGLNMKSTGSSNVLFNINYLSSREVADAFIEKYSLRKKLFDEKLKENGNFDDSSFNLKKYLLNWIVQDPLENETVLDEDLYDTNGPTKRVVFKKFKRVFKVSVSEKNMTASVVVKWKDPFVAKHWANDYAAFVNKVLKDKAIRESELKIKYLEGQINEVPSVEVQQSIYSLIESEMKNISVAQSSDEYAFKVIQRAFLPEKKESPKRKMYLAFGMVFGILLAFIRIYISNFRKS